jgi:hypothetical protein
MVCYFLFTSIFFFFFQEHSWGIKKVLVYWCSRISGGWLQFRICKCKQRYLHWCLFILVSRWFCSIMVWFGLATIWQSIRLNSGFRLKVNEAVPVAMHVSHFACPLVYKCDLTAQFHLPSVLACCSISGNTQHVMRKRRAFVNFSNRLFRNFSLTCF